ncbi:MAG: hypothetical protein JWR02_1129 [Mucilaginibacter sp.]|nr:hypothetical protein [Mucilaginibacter sp.]
MNKLKLLSILVGLISWTSTKAQLVIDINKDGYFINEKKIEYPMPLKSLSSALGGDYRVFDGINTIYTYDQLGLRLYEPLGSRIVKSLFIDFVNGSYKFSSKQPFKGSLIINGHKIDKAFTKDSVSNIQNLFFDRSSSIKSGYRAVTFNDITLYFIFNEDGNIQSIAIGFSNIKNDFQTQLQNSDPNSTLINLDFKYERGVKDHEGKKAGIWEYYDDPTELILRYDHDADSIMYLKKNYDDFVTRDGEMWVHAKLDIYPRVIGSNGDFRQILGSLISYPVLARRQRIMGRVYVSFIINKTGNIQDVKIEKDIGGNCGEAVANALTSLKLSWTHAVKNNVSYDSRFIIPVTFALGLENKTPVIPPDGKLFLPDAYILPELNIIALGTPRPISN